jgi:hypothetical protein
MVRPNAELIVPLEKSDQALPDESSSLSQSRQLCEDMKTYPQLGSVVEESASDQHRVSWDV